MQFLKEYDIKLYYEDLLTRYKELEKQEQRELQATHPHPHYDPLQLYFIHNARALQLLKESHKDGVFIDKLLVILSHEFLLYERNTIDITLESLCNYLCIDHKKPNVNYIRREIKAITEFLIERGFIESLAIKNSVLKCTLNTLFIREMKEKRLITRIEKKALSFSSDAYKIKRLKTFFKNNLNKKENELNINFLMPYIIDSNKSRKRKKIIDYSKT